jgi:hypothetical protein
MTVNVAAAASATVAATIAPVNRLRIFQVSFPCRGIHRGKTNSFVAI